MFSGLKQLSLYLFLSSIVIMVGRDGRTLEYSVQGVPKKTAAEVASATSDKKIQQWIQGLGSSTFGVREAAVKALVEAGPIAMPAVQKAVMSKDGEIRSRALKVAREIEQAATKRLVLVGAELAKNDDGSVIQVVFQPGMQDPETDGLMVWLLGFPQLESLVLKNTKVTNNGLHYVGMVPKLKDLFIQDCRITDDGLKNLGSLTTLVSVSLYKCPINGSGLVHLKNSPGLSSLHLDQSQITDKGLATGIEGLKGAAKLRDLSLAFTEVGDDGVSILQHLRFLGTLSLTQTRITDHGVVHLAKCTGLAELRLDSTQISDRGLKHLLALKELTYLGLDNTPRLPAASLDQLRTMPSLKFLSVGSQGRDNLSDALTRVVGPMPPDFGSVLGIDRVKQTIEYRVLYPQWVAEEIFLESPEGKKVREVRTKILAQPVVNHYPLNLFAAYDVDGKKIATEIAFKRVVIGSMVLVSKDGKMIHADYLRALSKDVVILVPPPPGLYEEFVLKTRKK